MQIHIGRRLRQKPVSFADDTVKEARLLQQLAKLEGFLSYEGWQIVPMGSNELGYDIYLLGTFRAEGALRWWST